MNLRSVAGAVIVILAVAAGLSAQAVTVQLEGTVSYDGVAIPGVTITAGSTSTKQTETEITQADGTFSFTLTPGEYEITGALVGFHLERKHVTLAAGQPARVEFVLTPLPIVEHRPPPAPEVPTACPATLPSGRAFVPPAPYPSRAPASSFWHGSDALWTLLRRDGTWRGVPPDRGFRLGYRDKVFWWRPGFHPGSPEMRNLVVTARRLDAEAPLYTAGPATNAHHPDFGGWTILTALDIPTTGCWQIIADLAGSRLSFVVWVMP